MTSSVRLAVLVGAAALACSAGGLRARANGAEFFEAQNDGKVVLYYFGSVKDSKGAVLDKVTVRITAKNANLTFPFRNDTPGHFRSPDIGRAIEGAGKTVDPSQLEITASKTGYKLVKAPKIPGKLGAVQLDTIVLDPVPASK